MAVGCWWMISVSSGGWRRNIIGWIDNPWDAIAFDESGEGGGVKINLRSSCRAAAIQLVLITEIESESNPGVNAG